EQHVAWNLGIFRHRETVRLARVLGMLCLLAAFSAPAAANWSDDPERCDDANELERGTAAWYEMCVPKDESKSPPPYLPSIDPHKLADDVYSDVKQQCEASSVDDAKRQRCMIDVSLYYRAKAQCGAEPTAPVGEELRACIGDAKVTILMQEEPAIRARCSSKKGQERIDCVDETYTFGPLSLRERLRNELAAGRHRQTRDTRASDLAGTRTGDTRVSHSSARHRRPRPAVRPATA